VLDHWANNYFHWVVYCLPKVAVLAGMGLCDTVLLPGVGGRSRFIEESLHLLGVDTSSAPRLERGVTALEDLVVVHGGRFGPQLLQRLRERLTAGTRARVPARRLFISRRRAQWRRLRDEGKLVALVSSLGFEIVEPEGLSFGEQVGLFSEADLVVAPNGAGLANTVWCAAGTTVVALGASSRTAPDFYRLCLAMGHRYWLVEGELEDDGRPEAHRDLVIDPADLQRTLGHILE